MSDVPILDQISPIQQQVPKCAELTIVAAYRRGLRLWCAQSRWFRRNLSAQVLQGMATYSLGADPIVEIVDVPMGAIHVDYPNNTVQKFPMKPSDPSMFDPNAPRSRPFTYAYLPEGSITFYYVPNQDYNVTLTLALSYTDHTEVMDSTLLPKWHAVFEAGALMYLLGLKSEAWYDPPTSMLYSRIFQSGVHNAKADVARLYQSGTVMGRRRGWITAS
jgi:hypothetical protein